MGRTLTVAEETALLRDVIRQGHEVVKDLRAAIRDANSIAPRLVAEFEKLHKREMEQLSNHMTAEGNTAAANLNKAVDDARAWILKQLTATEMVLDKSAQTISLRFPAGHFDDQVPPPYPEHTPRESPR